MEGQHEKTLIHLLHSCDWYSLVPQFCLSHELAMKTQTTESRGIMQGVDRVETSSSSHQQRIDKSPPNPHRFDKP